MSYTPVRSRGAWRRSIVASLAAFAVVVTSMILPAAATAASPVAPFAVPGGPATVTTSVDYVSGTDLSTPITELKATYGVRTPTDAFALSVGYACGSASACTDVTIAIAPQQLDSTYGQYRFARYTSSTLPGGATISGTDATGHTVRLGNLPAGATGAFTVVFTWQDRSTSVASQSFFLDGEKIRNTVTIDAANASTTHSASDEITWRIDTMAPQVAFAPQGLARADQDYDYVLRMGSDCMWYRTTANHGEPSKLCAASYTNTFHLPAGAVFVSSSPDGTYDPSARTVTWTSSGAAAATGWGSSNGFSLARTVKVQYPASIFTDSCMAVAKATFETDVTYLDGAVKSANTAVTHDITSCAPFALATRVEKTSEKSLNPNLLWDDGSQYNYTIRIGNKANVPGVAVITDDQLGADHIRAYEVKAAGARIAYVLDDGTTGTATGTYTAPSGRRIMSIVVTTPEIAGPNKEQTSTALTTYYSVVVRYTTVGKAPDEGWPVSNTASGVMTYPGTSLADYDSGSDTVDLVITPRPASFKSVLTGASSTPGNPVPGVPVDYRLHGVTSLMEPTDTVEPQYVFVAPANWGIIADSWSLASGAPAGATFERKNVTIAGTVREALFVHWPAGTVWGMNSTWPQLHVQATPSAMATPGSAGVATGYIGDASHSFPGYAATWGGSNNDQRYTDATDIDGDGVLTEYFAAANAKAITVGSAAALSSVKEICRVNPDAADGCDWIADSTQAVPVSPVATDIKYRVTLRNNGTSALSNVVGYDILPHPGDTGISGDSALTPRGSDFAESVSGVSDVSSALTLSYSDSTNPCRAQVYVGGPAGCVSDWDESPSGALAIRAAVTGTLAPGASVSFTYTADVLGAPIAGEQACNSIATAANGVPVSEPSPVCAIVEAADLAVVAGTPDDLQIGRPAVLPFTVSNESGTKTAASVTIDIPADVSATALSFGDWTCDSGGAAAPVGGPATLVCTLPEALADGDSVELELPVIISASGVTVTATVGGAPFDPVPGNNSDAITVPLAAAATGITVTKDDGLPALVAGQQTTYTITVGNQLIGESLSGVEIVDTLPAGVTFVSASDGGTHAAGTVTWSLATLAAAGTTSVTVTVRVADAATGTSLSNAVTASAADPAFPDAPAFTGSARDVDHLDRIALAKTVTMRSPGDPFDPQVGDVLEYEFEVSNRGGGELTEIALSDPKPGLSAITFPDGWPTTKGTLGAGESVTAVATYELTAADIDAGTTANTAHVTGLSAGGAQAEATSSVDFDLPQTGAIALTKEADLDLSGIVRAGDEIEYSFEIVNTGNVTLREVAVADPLTGLSAITYAWPGVAGSLGAGQAVKASATYRLTQADIDAGAVTNTATASGTDVLGTGHSASATAEVSIPAAASASFVKEGRRVTSGELAKTGDEVEFTFAVKNTGNVTLTAVEIADHLDGVSVVSFDGWPAADGELAPGERVTATAGYVVTQADIDRGSIENTATLTATPVRGEVVEEDAAAEVTLAQASGLVIEKSAELLDGNGDALANQGEQIRYSFRLENTGNVTLDDVTVDDPKVTGIPVTTTIAPGQTVVVFADSYTVTGADALSGSVRNTAVVSATVPDGTEITSEPSSTVTEARALGGLATTGLDTPAWAVLTAGGIAVAGVLLMLLTALRRRRLVED